MLQDKPEIIPQLVKISIYSLPVFFLILAVIYTSFGKKKIKISQNKLRMICWSFLLYLLCQWIVFQFASFNIIGDVYSVNRSQIIPMWVIYAGLVLSVFSIGLVFNLSKQIDLKKTKNFQLILSRIALSAIPICITALFLSIFF
ncbi:MAG: hypothetical protein KR126chlam4_01550 [Candidatus Anoxychlamydiales bacterium]|nr:hypothetical protein [Candidatus Anoxychlamydiales bacterium]